MSEKIYDFLNPTRRRLLQSTAGVTFGAVGGEKFVRRTVETDNSAPNVQNGLAYGDGYGYTTNDDGQVEKFDIDTYEVVNRFAAPSGTNSGLAFGDGSLWYSDGNTSNFDGEIIELNPDTGDVRSRITMGFDPPALAFGGGSLWMADITSNDIVEYSPSGEQRNSFDVRDATGSTSPRALAYFDGALWLGTSDTSTLYKFSTDGTLQESVQPHSTAYKGLATTETELIGPDSDGNLTVLLTLDEASSDAPNVQNGLAYGDGYGYTTNDDGQVEKFDIDTYEVVNRFAAPSGTNSGLAFGDGSLWYSDGNTSNFDGEIIELDPGTGDVQSRITMGFDPPALAFGGGSLWVADITSNDIVEYSPSGEQRNNFDIRGATGSTSPRALAYFDGSLWLGTGDTATLYKFSTDGSLQESVQPHSTGYRGLATTETELIGPDSDGNLIVLLTLDDSNTGPTAEFSVDPSNPTVGESVSLDASASSDPDGSISSYDWDIGNDGNFERSGREIEWSFSDAGDRKVTLRVTDDDGATSSKSKTVAVSSPNEAPTASFTASADGGYYPPFETSRPVQLDASESSDTNGSITSYEWDLDGDGEYERSGEQIDVTFDRPGDKEVTLRVTDTDGATDTFSLEFPVAFKGTAAKMRTARNVDSASVLSTVSDDLGFDFSDESMAQSSLNELNSAGAAGDIPPAAGEEAVFRLRQAERAGQRVFDTIDNGKDGPGDDLQYAKRTARYIIELVVEYIMEALMIGETLFKKLPDWAQIDKTYVSGLIDDSISRLLNEMTRGSEARDRIKQESKAKAEGLFEELKNGTISTAEELKQGISAVADELTEIVAKFIQATVETGALKIVTKTAVIDSAENLTEGNINVWDSLMEAHEKFRPDQLPPDGSWSGNHSTVESVVSTGTEDIQTNMENLAGWFDIVRNHILDIGVIRNLVEAWNAYQDAKSEFNSEDGSILDIGIDVLRTVVNATQAVVTIIKGKAGLFVAAGSTLASANVMVWASNRTEEVIDSVVTGEDRLEEPMEVPSPDETVAWLDEFSQTVENA